MIRYAMRKTSPLALLLALAPACSERVLAPDPPDPPAPEAPTLFTYEIVARFDHDEAAFTQGLLWHDGFFYESTGLFGQSSLRRVVPETGEVAQRIDVDRFFFAEGLALHAERLYQLTWLGRRCFVYDRESFAPLDTLEYPTQGWGLTTDGSRFLMTDGSDTLYFRDLETFEEIGRVTVRDTAGAVSRLNELEWIDGKVWANVLDSDSIAVIDPATGFVDAWIDLTGLLAEAGPAQNPSVMNGIAYDAAGDRLFVTGKRWPKVFEIRLIEILPETAPAARPEPVTRAK